MWNVKLTEADQGHREMDQRKNILPMATAQFGIIGDLHPFKIRNLNGSPSS